MCRNPHNHLLLLLSEKQVHLYVKDGWVRLYTVCVWVEINRGQTVVNLFLLWPQRDNQRWKWAFCNLRSITMQSDLMLIHSRRVSSRRENLIWTQQEICIWKLWEGKRKKQIYEAKQNSIIIWWCKEAKSESVSPDWW